MSISKGRAVSGRIVVGGEPLEGGTIAIAEAERGETIGGEEVLRELNARG